MEWIKNAANEWNDESQRQEMILRKAPILWDNICRATEQAVEYYSQLRGWFPVEFSGRANHTIAVMVFEGKRPDEPNSER